LWFQGDAHYPPNWETDFLERSRTRQNMQNAVNHSPSWQAGRILQDAAMLSQNGGHSKIEILIRKTIFSPIIRKQVRFIIILYNFPFWGRQNSPSKTIYIKISY